MNQDHLRIFLIFLLLSAGITQLIKVHAQDSLQKQEKKVWTFETPGDPYYKSRSLLGPNAHSFFNLGDLLVGRAILPAATFAKGPTSGNYITSETINGQSIPFINKQPVQGFSAILNNHDGSFTALSDNGYGSLENSSDYNLRLYHIRPTFKSLLKPLGGDVTVEEFTELRDPNNKISFAIVNHFSKERILTGADFDIESIQRDAKGDYWIGDEFGPFILHFDKNGTLLDPPYALPDFNNPGKELRAPQNPYNEEYSAQRVMNAMRAHAHENGSRSPVMSPWSVMLKDNNPATVVESRDDASNGLTRASSEVHNLVSLNEAGHDVVVYTVNDMESMNQLLELGVQGIISDRPDLLLEAVQNFDKDHDGKADFIDQDGLIDVSLFDAQGHRGARDLRPENTLPAMEAALDNLMPTLETDAGITLDGIPILDHDPHIEASKTRRADGSSYIFEEEVLIKNLTLQEIQATFIADKILPGRPTQTNDRNLSPVTTKFSRQAHLMDNYVMPSLQQLFDFVAFYTRYYKEGVGSAHPEAVKRWKNAEKVRFNIETKVNPRTDLDDRGDVFAARTVEPEVFTKAVAEVIIANKLENRADIQSFDFRTLLIAHKRYPTIRTVCLFGDFPKNGVTGDGTNLQGQNGENTPWLAGLYWPYRSTKLDNPFNVQSSGGFEGMALTTDKKYLLPLLEKPLQGARNLLIHEFDLDAKSYTGKKYEYPIDTRATAIGDFVMFNEKRGLIVERDGTQGDLGGFKAVYEIEIDADKGVISKKANLDLLKIRDVGRISQPGAVGDVGIGKSFAFPFVTIESIVVFNPFLIGVLNDNNYPFSVGRHVRKGLPDDTEFILVWLDQPLGKSWSQQVSKNTGVGNVVDVQAYPTIFSDQITFSGKVLSNQEISITIYDFQGNVVRQLVKKNIVTTNFSYAWNGKTLQGREVKNGVYIAIIKIGDELLKKKIVKRY